MNTTHITKLSFLTSALGLAQLPAATLSVLSDSASPYYTTGIGFPPGISLPVDGGSGVNDVGGASLQSANSGSQLSNAIFVFQLPSLGAVVNPFTDASFTVTLASTSGNSAYDFNPFSKGFDLYGLGSRASATVFGSDFYAGSAGGDATDATLLKAQITGVGNVPVAGTSFSITDSSVLSYFNAQYAGGVGAGNFAFLRINSNYNAGSFSNQSWAADSNTFVTLSAVPEPDATLALGVGLGTFGCLLRKRRRPEGV